MKRIVINGEELMVRISPSFLQNAACPFYLRLRYVEKLDSRYIRIGALRGKTAHAAIADLIKYCMDERCSVQDLDDGLLREALQRHLVPEILSETSLVYSWLRRWKERFKLPNNIHGIEEKVALDDDYEECDWEAASYRGIIDLSQVSGSHAIITDWKSQPHILSPGELDEFEQGTMYCFLAQKLLPFLKTFTFRIFYLRYGFYQETTRSEEDLEAFETALILRERKIAELDNWDPIPGPQCQYCEYIHRCPIALDLSPANPEIITQEQATLAGQRLVVLEALTKDLKDRLKPYVNANDDVRLGDKFQWGYKHSTSLWWEPTEVEEILRDNDRDLSEVANVGSKKMKKLIKEVQRNDPLLARQLEDAAKVKHKTEFKGFKSGEDDDSDEEPT